MKQVVALCTIIILFAQASAIATPAEVAEKAFSSEQRTSFSGVMVNTVYLPEGAQSSIVRVQRLRSKSRMDYTSGPLRGVTLVDDGQSVYRISKASKSVVTTSTAERPSNLKLLLANYNALGAGTEMIAGRRAQVLRLDPKHAGNPKVKLWVDSKTGVVLRNERYLYNGKLAARSEYKSINYSSIPQVSSFTPPAGWHIMTAPAGAHAISAKQLESKVGFSLLKPSYVPSGYVLAGHFLQTTGRGMPMAALKYTNGLNTISIFEHRCSGGMGCGGCGFGRGRGMRRGCGQCILRSDPQAEIAQRFVGSVMIVVMGNVSPSLAEKMANSF